MRIRKRANLPPPESPVPAPPQSPPAPSPPLSSRAAPRLVLPDPRPKYGGDVNIRQAAAAVVQEAANPRWGFFNNYQQREDGIEDEGYHTTSPRKESVNLAAELIASMRYSSYTSSYSTGGRGEGYRTFLPLKKRKGGFEGGIGGASREGSAYSNNAYVKEEMKSKTNKKCLLQNGYPKEAEYDEDEKNVFGGGDGGGGSKKCKRGSVIMEGSRCSRVNGRGWRCSQPTLVGYSLCEHHLGKGRLRSMNSSRNKGRMPAARAGDGDPPLKLGKTDRRAGDSDHLQKLDATDSHYGVIARVDQPGNDRVIAPMQIIKEEGKNLDSDDGEEEKKMQNIEEVGKNLDSDDAEEEKNMNPLVQKKIKPGVVKARSMSSLLGQMDGDNKEVTIPDNMGNNRFPWLL